MLEAFFLYELMRIYYEHNLPLVTRLFFPHALGKSSNSILFEIYEK